MARPGQVGDAEVGEGAVRANSRNQRGRLRTSGANRRAVLTSICSGMTGLPQSRPFEKDQSNVAIRPTAPAALARSRRSDISSLSPTQ